MVHPAQLVVLSGCSMSKPCRLPTCAYCNEKHPAYSLAVAARYSTAERHELALRLAKKLDINIYNDLKAIRPGTEEHTQLQDGLNDMDVDVYLKAMKNCGVGIPTKFNPERHRVGILDMPPEILGMIIRNAMSDAWPASANAPGTLTTNIKKRQYATVRNKMLHPYTARMQIFQVAKNEFFKLLHLPLDFNFPAFGRRFGPADWRKLIKRNSDDVAQRLLTSISAGALDNVSRASLRIMLGAWDDQAGYRSSFDMPKFEQMVENASSLLRQLPSVLKGATAVDIELVIPAQRPDRKNWHETGRWVDLRKDGAMHRTAKIVTRAIATLLNPPLWGKVKILRLGVTVEGFNMEGQNIYHEGRDMSQEDMIESLFGMRDREKHWIVIRRRLV